MHESSSSGMSISDFFSGPTFVIFPLFFSAFGKLKGQWKVLSFGLQTRTPLDWKNTLTTCCILHNLTITYGNQGWRFSDTFKTGRPSRDADAASLDKDPDATKATEGIFKDDKRAVAWRESLVTKLRSRGFFDR